MIKDMRYIILLLLVILVDISVYAGYDPTKTLYPYEYDPDTYESIAHGGDVFSMSHNANAGSASANQGVSINITLKDNGAFDLSCYDWYIELFTEFKQGKKYYWNIFSAGSLNLNRIASAADGDVVNDQPKDSYSKVLESAPDYKYWGVNFNDFSLDDAISQNTYSLRIVFVRKGGVCGEEVVQEKFYEPGTWAFGETYDFDFAPTTPSSDIKISLDNSTFAYCEGDKGGKVTATVTDATNYTVTWSEGGADIGGKLGLSGTGNSVAQIDLKQFTPGVHTITATATDNDNAKTATADFTLTVNAKPNITLSADKPAICQNESVKLSVTPTGLKTYTIERNTGGAITSQSGASWTTTQVATSDYKAYVVDVNNCKDTSNVVNVVTKPSIAIAAITVTPSNPLCAGSEVSISADVPSDNTVSFSWEFPKGSTAQAGATAKYTPNASATNVDYKLTVTKDGCPTEVAQALSLNTPPSFTVTNPAAVCEGNTVDITASSVIGNVIGLTVKYYQEAGCITELTNPTAIAASGTSHIKAINTAGCSTVKPVTVTVNPLPVINIDGGDAPVCDGTTVTLTANPATGFTYQWSDNTTGASISPKVTASNKDFTLTATKNSCSKAVTKSITVNPVPELTLDPVANDCSGEDIALTANVTINGTLKSQGWSWTTTGSATDGGIVDATQASTTAKLPKGNNTYTFTVSNENCTTTKNVKVTGNYAQATLTGTVGPVIVGATINLTATDGHATTTGQTFDFWRTEPAPVTHLDGPLAKNTYTESVTETSTYKVIVTGAPADGECKDSATYKIEVTPNPFNVEALLAESNKICKGSTDYSKLVYSVKASGGKTPYTYTWSVPSSITYTQSAGGDTIRITGIDASVTTGLPLTIQVTVAEGGGKSAVKQNSLTVNPLPDVKINGDNGTDLATCLQVGAKLSLTAAGATTYEWSAPVAAADKNKNPLEISKDAVNSGTIYEVTGKDANGCVNTATRNVIIHGLPDLALKAEVGGVEVTDVCPSTEVLLTASSNDVSTFKWTGLAGNGATQNVTPVTTGAVGTTYSVEVTDGNTCKNTKSVTIKLYTPETIKISPASAVVCAGSSVALTASGLTTASPVYAWTGGDIAGSVEGATYTTSAAGTYKVNGIDVNGCQAVEGSVAVTIKAGLNFALKDGGALTVCAPNTADLYNVVDWANSAQSATLKCATSASGAAEASTVVSAGGSYWVWLEQGDCSTDRKEVTVTINTQPDVALAMQGGNRAICSGEEITLIASSGAPGSPVFTWEDNTTGETHKYKPTSAVATTKNYEVTVKDANTCTNKASLAVTVNPLPVPKITGAPGAAICPGTQVTLSATGGDSYLWSPGNKTTNSVVVTPTTDNNTYRVVAKYDATGCQDSAKVTIAIAPTPTLLVKNPNPVCEGKMVNLSSDAIQSIGSGVNLEYFSDANGNNKLTNPIVTAAGDYWIRGSVNGGSCPTELKKVTVTNHAKPAYTLATADGNTQFCSGSEVTLVVTTSANLGYTWTGGTAVTGSENKRVYQLSNAGSSDITQDCKVTVRDKDHSCDYSETMTLDVWALPVVTLAAEKTAVCDGNGVKLTAGGALQYSWDGGSTWGVVTENTVFPAYADGASQVFTVHGKGEHCDNHKDITLTINQIPVISLADGGVLAGGCPGTQVDLLDAVSSDKTGLTFEYANTDDTPVTNPVTEAGTYKIKAKANGCESSVQYITVGYDPEPVLAVTPDLTEICSGTEVTFTLGGANTTTTYEWLDGATVTGGATGPWKTTLTTAVTGKFTYKLKGTDVNGCSTTVSMDITVNELPTVDYTTTGLSVFTGQQFDVIAQGVGGAGSYTYYWTQPEHRTNNGTYNATAEGSLMTFWVSVKDAKNCQSDSVKLEVTVTPQGGELKALISKIAGELVCKDGSVLLKVTPSGGVAAIEGAPYKYAWKEQGNNTILGAGETYAATAAGTYVVEVTDYGTPAQTVTSAPITLTASSIAAPKVNAGPDIYIPVGKQTVLAGSVEGSGSYTYSWTPANKIMGNASVINPQTIPLSEDQSYVLSVVEGNCAGSDEVTVHIDNTIMQVVASASSSSVCKNGSCQLDVNPKSGGTFANGTTYQWTPATGLDNPKLKNPVFSAGSTSVNGLTYTVVVTSGGKSTTANVVLKVNTFDAPSLALERNGSCTGSVIRDKANGYGNKYHWFLNDVEDLAVTGNQFVLKNAGSQVVKVYVEASNGCLSAVKEEVCNINPRPVIDWQIAPPSQVNIGESIYVSTKIKSATTPVYTWSWVKPDGKTEIGTTSSSSVMSADLTSSPYEFHVCMTDANGCTSDTLKESTVVIDPDKLIAKVVNKEITVCQNGMAELAVTVTGGIMPKVIEWFIAGTSTILGQNDTYVIKKVTAGQKYVVKVTDGDVPARIAYDTVTVKLGTDVAPTVNAGIDLQIAMSENTRLYGSVSGGSNPTFAWTPANALAADQTTLMPLTANLTGDVTYILTATDDKGCKAQDDVKVTVTSDMFVVNVTANPNPVCAGGTADLEVAKTSGNWSGSIGYTWFGMDAASLTSSLTATNISNPRFNAPNAAGTYRYMVMVRDNGASNKVLYKGVDIVVEDCSGNLKVKAEDAVICAVKAASSQGVVTLKSSITPVGTAVNYAWRAIEGAPALTGTTDAANQVVNTAGWTAGQYKYEVKATDQSNVAVYALDTAIITVKASPVINDLQAGQCYPPLITATATNVKNDGYKWGIVNAPTGAQIYVDAENDNKVSLAWGDGEASTGSYTVFVKVENTQGCTDSMATTQTYFNPGLELSWKTKDTCAATLPVSLPVNLTSAYSGNYTLTYEFTPAGSSVKTKKTVGVKPGNAVLAATDAGIYELVSIKADNFATCMFLPKVGTGAIKVGTRPVLQLDEKCLALHKDSIFKLNVVNPTNFNYIWDVYVYNTSTSQWTPGGPGDHTAASTISGTMQDEDLRLIMTATEKSGMGCQAFDTAHVYRIPNAPVVTIDTAENRYKVKLDWQNVPMAEGYTVWSRKWDPYCMTSEEGGKYGAEGTQMVTGWAESSMDTLEFYYVTANRTINGATYYSHTSDTVGYHLFDVNVNPTSGKTSNNYMPIYFDFAAMGCPTTTEVGRRLKATGNAISMYTWNYTGQKTSISTYLKMTDKANPVVNITQDLGILMLSPMTNSDKFLQYGKLPRTSLNVKRTNTGTVANLNWLYVLPQKADKFDLGTLFSTDFSTVQILYKWDFATQTTTMITNLNGKPVGSNIKPLRSLMFIQVVLKAGETFYLWK